jgi:hypothetical protein
VHEHQVQADELPVPIIGGMLWLASAIAVPRRRWPGSVLRATHYGALIRALPERMWACGPVQAIQLCTNGPASCPSQVLRLFRSSEVPADADALRSHRYCHMPLVADYWSIR